MAATLVLYVDALNDGADAFAVRTGMSTLHLSRVSGLAAALVSVRSPAFAAYLQAAGLQASGETRLAVEGSRAVGAARDLMRTGQYANALSAVTEGDLSRQASHESRLLLGGIHRAKAEALFEQGRQDAALGIALAERDAESAAGLVQAALRDLNDAAVLQPHPSRLHAELVELYTRTGKPELAAAEWQAAFVHCQRVAARGISLAVVDCVRMFVDKAGRPEIGIAGILFLLVAATALLNTIERTFNHIWNVAERRPLWIKSTSSERSGTSASTAP